MLTPEKKHATTRVAKQVAKQVAKRVAKQAATRAATQAATQAVTQAAGKVKRSERSYLRHDDAYKSDGKLK